MKTSITLGQKKQVVRVAADATEKALEALGLDKDEGQSVLEQGNVFGGIILEALRKLSKTVRYQLTIDHGKSVEEMIAAGQYDWKNGDITSKNFPQSGTGVVTTNVELVHLGKDASSEAVLAHLEANGLRPATLAELLAFGATYPEIQCQFPVVVLGPSSWVGSVGGRRVPYLSRNDRDRVLDLYWGGGWYDICRFLAVRK